MISRAALEESIKEAGEAVRSRQQALADAQASLIDARRELGLLGELAGLRGIQVDQLHEIQDLSQDALSDVSTNGASRGRASASSPPARTALLGTVVNILAERAEPMQIRDLMSAVQERGVAIPGSGQQANLIAHITRDDRIVRPRRGFYALGEWGMTDAMPAKRTKQRRTRRNAGARV